MLGCWARDDRNSDGSLQREELTRLEWLLGRKRALSMFIESLLMLPYAVLPDWALIRCWCWWNERNATWHCWPRIDQRTDNTLLTIGCHLDSRRFLRYQNLPLRWSGSLEGLLSSWFVAIDFSSVDEKRIRLRSFRRIILRDCFWASRWKERSSSHEEEKKENDLHRRVLKRLDRR